MQRLADFPKHNDQNDSWQTDADENPELVAIHEAGHAVAYILANRSNLIHSLSLLDEADILGAILIYTSDWAQVWQTAQQHVAGGTRGQRIKTVCCAYQRGLAKLEMFLALAGPAAEATALLQSPRGHWIEHLWGTIDDYEPELLAPNLCEKLPSSAITDMGKAWVMAHLISNDPISALYEVGDRTYELFHREPIAKAVRVISGELLRYKHLKGSRVHRIVCDAWLSPGRKPEPIWRLAERYPDLKVWSQWLWSAPRPK